MVIHLLTYTLHITYNVDTRDPIGSKKKFYHQFSIVKYSYLPTDTFRKYVEMHVTRSKLTLKFTGYCRQTSYTDSTVIHTLVPEVAWELQSQFAPDYMHFNIFF